MAVVFDTKFAAPRRRTLGNMAFESSVGLVFSSAYCLIYSIAHFGLAAVFKFYLLPWPMVTHWCAWILR
jgi:hypothetical protein